MFYAVENIWKLEMSYNTKGELIIESTGPIPESLVKAINTFAKETSNTKGKLNGEFVTIPSKEN
jgi:hypothetical protein